MKSCRGILILEAAVLVLFCVQFWFTFLFLFSSWWASRAPVQGLVRPFVCRYSVSAFLLQSKWILTPSLTVTTGYVDASYLKRKEE